MKIFATTLEIQPVAPIVGQNVTDGPPRSAVGLEIKLLCFSPPEFDLVFDTPAEVMAAIAAVELVYLPVGAYEHPLTPLATLSWKGGRHGHPGYCLSQNS